MNRREALRRMGGLAAAGWLTGTVGAETVAKAAGEQLTTSDVPKGAEFTVAHITDIHIFDELQAAKWFARCLHEVQSHPAKPSLIINSGDCVMDTLSVDRDRAEHLWKLWNQVLKNENSLPVRQCLGNHDVWGLAQDNDAPSKNDPMYGKKLGLDGIGLDRGYYSFDHGDWHFIALDSIHPTGTPEDSGWIAQLDDEQFHWLEEDLKATPSDRPVAVYCHIPILQVCTMIYLKPEDGKYSMNSHKMMSDARRIIDLFAKHPNVKLCLSGHLHLQDRVELRGVTYICDGSVCGEWWKGAHLKCPPGYSIITFKPDGTFDHDYTTYGWKNDAAAAGA